MLTTTLSDFRKETKKYLDKVTNDFETLIINRGKDTGVVIMSIDEYNALQATHNEMSSRKNEQRLLDAIQRLKEGKGIAHNLLDA